MEKFKCCWWGRWIHTMDLGQETKWTAILRKTKSKADAAVFVIAMAGFRIKAGIER